MDLAAWLAAFRKLHEQARRNGLDEADMKTYLQGREELARALVTAQKLTLKEGQTPRQALRVTRSLACDLDLVEGRVRVLTQEISRGGFSALVDKPPKVGELVGFSLVVPGGDPIIGRCKLVDARAHRTISRGSFAFEGLTDAALDRLEMTIFDTVVEQFKQF